MTSRSACSHSASDFASFTSLINGSAPPALGPYVGNRRRPWGTFAVTVATAAAGERPLGRLADEKQDPLSAIYRNRQVARGREIACKMQLRAQLHPKAVDPTERQKKIERGRAIFHRALERSYLRYIAMTNAVHLQALKDIMNDAIMDRIANSDRTVPTLRSADLERFLTASESARGQDAPSSAQDCSVFRPQALFATPPAKKCAGAPPPWNANEATPTCGDTGSIFAHPTMPYATLQRCATLEGLCAHPGSPTNPVSRFVDVFMETHVSCTGRSYTGKRRRQS